MDELEQLLDEARRMGATTQQLEDIINSYNSKKKNTSKTTTPPSNDGTQDTSLSKSESQLSAESLAKRINQAVDTPQPEVQGGFKKKDVFSSRNTKAENTAKKLGEEKNQANNSIFNVSNNDGKTIVVNNPVLGISETRFIPYELLDTPPDNILNVVPSKQQKDLQIAELENRVNNRQPLTPEDTHILTATNPNLSVRKTKVSDTDLATLAQFNVPVDADNSLSIQNINKAIQDINNAPEAEQLTNNQGAIKKVLSEKQKEKIQALDGIKSKYEDLTATANFDELRKKDAAENGTDVLQREEQDGNSLQRFSRWALNFTQTVNPLTAILPKVSDALLGKEFKDTRVNLKDEYILGSEWLKLADPVRAERQARQIREGLPMSQTEIAAIETKGAQLMKMKADNDLLEKKITPEEYLTERQGIQKKVQESMYKHPEVLYGALMQYVGDRWGEMQDKDRGLLPAKGGGAEQVPDSEIERLAKEGAKRMGLNENDPTVIAAIEKGKKNESWMFGMNAIPKKGYVRDFFGGVSGVVGGIGKFIEGKSGNEAYIEGQSDANVNIAEQDIDQEKSGWLMYRKKIFQGAGQFAAQAGLALVGGEIVGGVAKAVELAGGVKNVASTVSAVEGIAGGEAVAGSAMGADAIAGVNAAFADGSLGIARSLAQNELAGTIVSGATNAKNIAGAIRYGKDFISTAMTSYAQSYDSNYKQAQSYTADDDTAHKIAQFQSAMEGFSENILSPVSVLRKMGGLFKTENSAKALAKIFTEGNIIEQKTALKAFVSATVNGAKGFTGVVAPEILEEAVSKSTDLAANAIFNPATYKNKDLLDEYKTVAIETGLSMAIPALITGVGAFKASTFQKSSLLFASQTKEQMLDLLNDDLAAGKISEKDYNTKTLIINTASEFNDNLPLKDDGKPMTSQQKEDYIYSRVQKAVIDEKLKNTAAINYDIDKPRLEAKKAEVDKDIASIMAEKTASKPTAGEPLSRTKDATPIYKIRPIGEPDAPFKEIFKEVSKEEFDKAMQTPEQFDFEVTGDEKTQGLVEKQGGKTTPEPTGNNIPTTLITDIKDPRVKEIESKLTGEEATKYFSLPNESNKIGFLNNKIKNETAAKENNFPDAKNLTADQVDAKLKEQNAPTEFIPITDIKDPRAKEAVGNLTDDEELEYVALGKDKKLEYLNNKLKEAQPVETPIENKEEKVSVPSKGEGDVKELGNNTIIADMSLPFDEGVNTGLVKNSKGAVYHDRNSAKLDKLGYSKEQIDNLSQTELNEILAKNIENPNVETSAKLPVAEVQTTTQDFLNEAGKGGGRFAELAKALKDFFGIGEVETTIVKGLKNFFGGKNDGDYSNNQIRIDEKAKNKLQTFLHEAVHKVTVEKLLQFERGDNSKLSEQDIDALQNLTRIFAESKTKIHEYLGGGKGDRTKGHYGFTNVHEFISEAFANPEFQRLLKNLPTEGKNPTIFKQFLDAVAKFLGLKDASILNDIFHHTENLNEAKPTTKPTVQDDVKPIRQLGSGANVYFETDKYRVNDSKDGKVYLNVGNAKDITPLANIEFDNKNEAVFVAKKLQENAPEGLTADFHNVDKIIENYKNEFKEQSNPPQSKGNVAILGDAHNNNPELSKIGTEQEYSDYIKTVFPDSQVKDVVYHRSNEKFDEFDNGKLNKDTGGLFDFSKDNNQTRYGKNLYPVLLNIKKLGEGFILENGVDGTQSTVMGGEKIYSVPDSKQIHILGSKKDIDGFKKWKENKKATPTGVKDKVVGSGVGKPSSEKNELYNVPILLDPKAKVRGDKQEYIPREVFDKAFEKDDREGINYQTAETLIRRGGYSTEELNKLLPNWREFLPTQEVKDKVVGSGVAAPVSRFAKLKTKPTTENKTEEKTKNNDTGRSTNEGGDSKRDGTSDAEKTAVYERGSDTSTDTGTGGAEAAQSANNVKENSKNRINKIEGAKDNFSNNAVALIGQLNEYGENVVGWSETEGSKISGITEGNKGRVENLGNGVEVEFYNPSTKTNSKYFIEGDADTIIPFVEKFVRERQKPNPQQEGNSVVDNEITKFIPHETQFKALERLTKDLPATELNNDGTINTDKRDAEIKRRAELHDKDYQEQVSKGFNEVKGANKELPRVKNFEGKTIDAMNKFLENPKDYEGQKQTFKNGSRIDENGNPIPENDFVALKERVAELRKQKNIAEINKIDEAPSKYIQENKTPKQIAAEKFAKNLQDKNKTNVIPNELSPAEKQGNSQTGKVAEKTPDVITGVHATVGEVKGSSEELRQAEQIDKAASRKGTFKSTHGFSFEDVDSAVEKAKTQSKSNINPIEQALIDLGIVKDREVAERNPAYSDYIKIKLEEQLPKKLPTKGEKLDVAYADDFTGNIDVQPIEQKIKPSENTTNGRQASLGKYVSKDESRPAMTGVFHDAESKALVITDGHKLVWIKDPSIKENKIIDPKTGQEIEGNFPNYKQVIPQDNPIKVKGLSVQDLLNQTSGLDRANKFINGKEILSVIRIGEDTFGFDPKILNQVLVIMAENGAKEVDIELSTPNRAIVLSTPENKNVHGLLMPKLFSDELPHKVIFEKQYTIQEKKDIVQSEINKLDAELKERKKELSKSVADFRKATAKNVKSSEFEMEYNKKKVAEVEKQIEEKKTDLLSIDNPLEEQDNLQTIKENIDNGTITAEQATEHLAKTNEQLSQSEPIISDIESKAESDNEAELNEAIKKSDELISKPNFSIAEPNSTMHNDMVDWAKEIIKENPDVKLEGVQAEVKSTLGDNYTPEIKDLVDKAYEDASNEYVPDIVLDEIANKALNESFLKVGITVIKGIAAKGKEAAISGGEAIKKFVDNLVNPKDKRFDINNLPLQKPESDANNNFISKRLLPEEEQGRAESGSLNAEASHVLQRVYGAIKKAFGTITSRKAKAELKSKEQEYLEHYVKQTGQWLSNSNDFKVLKDKEGNVLLNEDGTEKIQHPTFGTSFASGQEQTVYHKDGDNFVTKLNDLSLNENVQEYLDRIALHNSNFKSTKLELVGFGKNEKGDFVVITKQPLIEGEVPTQQEIVDYMKGRGFKQQEEFEPDIANTVEAGKNFVNNDVIVEDLHRKNVIKGANGEMFVIDPDIKLNTPDKGFGGTRKIENTISETGGNSDIQYHYNEAGEILGVSYKDPITGENKIALNGDKINAKTTFEELGHAWLNTIKNTNPELHAEGLKKVLKTKYLTDVENNKFYQEEALKQGKKGSPEYNAYMQEEALAKAIADNGAKFLTETRRKDFKQWVNEMWKKVAEHFGIRDKSIDEIRKMSLEDFSKMAAADVFSKEKTQSENKGAEPPPPENQPNENGTPLEGDGIKIIHAETSELRKDFGLKGYEKIPNTEEEWNALADERIKNGEMQSVIKKLERGIAPDPTEQKMMGKYIAELEKKASDTQSDEDIKALQKAVELSDKIGGSLVGKSLVARKGTFIAEDSLGAYFLRELESGATNLLTDEQKAQVIKEYKEIEKAKKEYEASLNKLDKESSQKTASDEVKKAVAARPRANKTHEQFKKERESIIENMRKKLAKARGEFNATPIPYAKELIAISPDVAKMMKSYVEEGITQLADIVTNIHAILKDNINGITKEDVQDIIAGVYTTPKTRTELARQLQDIRDEAKLIAKLEALQNGINPKTEAGKRERNKNIKRLQDEIKEFNKKQKSDNLYSEEMLPDAKKLIELKDRNNKEAAKIKQLIDEGNYQKEKKKTPILEDAEVKKKFPDLYKEAIDAKDRLIKVKTEREIRLLQQEYENRTKAQKIKDATLEILNVPRTIMSSIDFSAPLRQAVIPTISHPFIAAKAFVEMFRQSVSQKRFDRWFFDLRQDPEFAIMEKSGLYIADPHDLKLSAKEEQFMNNLAEKIPLVGKLIKGSERAYVSYLNKMRVDLFKQGEVVLLSSGKNIDNAPKDYKALGSWVNNATGRGGFAKSETVAPILNTVFFSPRLIASRLNLLINPVYYYSLSPQVRKMALGDMAKFITFGLSVLALSSLGCGDDKDCGVETDPRSTDFGKIKVGDTRYDIWGGFQQYVRFISQLFSGQSKSASGKIREIDGSGRFGEDRGDLVTRFFRGKLAPLPATATDLITGRTIMGDKIVYKFGGDQLFDYGYNPKHTRKINEVTVTDEALKLVMPLVVNDVAQGIKTQGVKALGTIWLPATFGIGVQSYSAKK